MDGNAYLRFIYEAYNTLLLNLFCGMFNVGRRIRSEVKFGISWHEEEKVNILQCKGPIARACRSLYEIEKSLYIEADMKQCRTKGTDEVS